jgi:hypothetical protein
MGMPEYSEEAFFSALDRACEKGVDIARTRCLDSNCGIDGVIITPVSAPEQRSEDFFYFSDLLHAIACERGQTCHFAQNPMEITAVAAEALEQAIGELGLVGMVESPDVGGRTSSN